jgi:protein-L-isoaspartate(D-aspartate) O-methyltransferase
MAHDRDDENSQMIRSQILARGVSDPRVLEALRSVPRELFVSPGLRSAAYDDTPLPLGCGQTISQPFIVGLMTQLLRLSSADRVLEIGAGSGYQTAVLARLAGTVYATELERELAEGIEPRLEALGIGNVVLRVGDGTAVFRDEAPFDAILSAAAPREIPEGLTAQLAEGGRCVIPAGTADLQYLYLVERSNGRLTERRLDPVRFVPLRS